MRVTPQQYAFSAGEVAPSLYGRSDLSKYASACRLMRNWLVHPHGGASTRPGTYYVAPLVDESLPSIMVPFTFNVTNNYQLVFGDTSMNVVKGYDFVRFGVANTFDDAIDGLEAIRTTYMGSALQIQRGNEVSVGAQRLFVEGTHNATIMDIDTTVAGKLHITLDATPCGLTPGVADTPPTLIFKVSGDFDISSRVAFTAVEAGMNSAIGIVARDSFSPSDRQFYSELVHTTSNTYQVTSGLIGTASSNGATTNVEHWLRIKREGKTFSTYYSTDAGTTSPTWTAGYTVDIPAFSNEAEFGLFMMCNSLTHTSGAISGEFGEVYEVSASYGEPYEITTPYTYDDLSTLKYSQTADTMYLTHPSYPPYKLTRSADDNWTLVAVTYGSGQSRPTNPTRIVGSGTTNNYVLTSMSATGEESVQSNSVSAAVGDTLAWLMPVGAAWYSIYVDPGGTHGFYGWIGDVNVDEHEGALQAITGISKANPAVVTCVGHGFAAGDYIYITGVGGMVEVTAGYYRVGATPGTNDFHLETTAGVDIDSSGYTAYTSGGTARKVGTYVTQNIYPDWETTPPVDNQPFSGAGNYPGSCAFFEQRMVYARNDNYPQTIWGSQIGYYDNFNCSHALRDSESYEFTLDSRQQNEILWLLPLDRLLIGTAGNEWRMDGGTSSDTITPTAVNVRAQSQWGSANIAPLVVGDTVLYVQYGSRNIRELAYSLESDRYVGRDLTILGNHLFKNRTIVSWCFQRVPNSVIWCVMSDGKLIGLTYLKEQEVWAWHQHQTDGLVEACSCIPDGNGNDMLYLIVVRSYHRYIEILQEAETAHVEDAFCVDCGLTYSGADATTVYGLNHIEGKPVVVLADGFVHTGLTVVDGQVEIPTAAHKIHVGLPYTCDIETLDFSPSSPTDTLADKVRRVVSCTLILDSTRALWIGPDSTRLSEITFRGSEDLDDMVELYSGTKEVTLKAGDPKQSRIWLRVSEPLPATVLSLIPRLDVAGT